MDTLLYAGLHVTLLEQYIHASFDPTRVFVLKPENHVQRNRYVRLERAVVSG